MYHDYATKINAGITQRLGGNRCFHDPRNPNYYVPPEDHGPRPYAIQLAQQMLEKFYVEPRSYLQSLFLFRKSPRQERSEARERDVMVLGVILHHLELASMRVGTPLENGVFLSLSIIAIAIRLGWRKKEDTGTKGIKRAWRCLKNLKTAGYITVHRRFKRSLEGEKDYIGLPAVRCVTAKLFYELGIKLPVLAKDRKAASKRLKKIYRAYQEKLATKLNKITGQAATIADAVKDIFTPKCHKTNQNRTQGLKALQELEHRLRKRQQQLNKRLTELIKIPINRNKSKEALIEEYPELKELPQIEKALQRA